MTILKRYRRWFIAGLVVTALAAISAGTAFAVLGDRPTRSPGAQPLTPNEFGPEGEDGSVLLERNLDFISKRTAGSKPLDIQQAGALRAKAARQAGRLRHQGGAAKTATATFTNLWSAIGPTGLIQPTRDSFSLIRVSGRIGALAIREDGTRILGAAQGGIWLWNGTSWVSKTDDLPSLAIGALAVAPSNDMIVYAGTGEGALSGDSYFGNGILKSTDGGNN